MSFLVASLAATLLLSSNHILMYTRNSYFSKLLRKTIIKNITFDSEKNTKRKTVPRGEVKIKRISEFCQIILWLSSGILYICMYVCIHMCTYIFSYCHPIIFVAGEPMGFMAHQHKQMMEDNCNRTCNTRKTAFVFYCFYYFGAFSPPPRIPRLNRTTLYGGMVLFYGMT